MFMTWQRSLPAVLLLTLAVPTAKANPVSRAPVATPTVRRVRDDGASQRNLQQQALSEETIAQAGEYLRLGADSRSVSEETRVGWERFYHRCDATIRRFAATFRSRGVDVDDCTQEVWADLIRSLPQFKLDSTRGRFDSWLYTIVRSKATDILRRQNRTSTTELSPAVMARAATSEVDPSEILDRQSDRDSVQGAMKRLEEVASESSYRVLHLRYIAGWSVQQVADALGFSREQVWVREHRMKRKLRELLADHFEASIAVNDSAVSGPRKIA
jgi:RNA polymerase sigma factor (sigma-70 family)